MEIGKMGESSVWEVIIPKIPLFHFSIEEV
jgi:hypothetical protein